MTAAPTLSSRLSPTDLPADLAVRTLLGLRTFRVRRLRRALALASAGMAAGAVYAVLAWPALRDEVAGSSFLQLARLAASDPDVVAAGPGDYAFGLIENLPLGALLTALTFVFLFLGAAAALLKIRVMRRPPFSGRSSAIR